MSDSGWKQFSSERYIAHTVQANLNRMETNNALDNRVDGEFGLTCGSCYRINQGASRMGRKNNCVAKSRF